MEQEEILARVSGSFKEWRPTERQEQFLQVPYSVFEILYGGALGGGKSEVGLVYPIVSKTIFSGIQLYQHPSFKGIIFRRTFQQLNKSLIPRAEIMYKAVGATYNKTDKLFEFPDRNGVKGAGGKIWLAHMENEKDVTNYDTDEYNYVFIDQAEAFTEFQLRYISSRIRSSDPDLPKVYRLSANPGGISHVYLRDRFVKPNPSGGTLLRDKATNNTRMFIPAKLEDNPHLQDNDPDYLNRLQLLPEEERKAKITGDWFTFSGQMFSEFRQIHIPTEPPNALHVIPPFVIPSFWPRILAIDWGYKAQTFGIWGALSPLRRLYAYRCYSGRGKTVRTWAADIARNSQDENIVRVALDPSAWQERGHELTIAQEFEVYSGMIPEKADNDRHSGVSLIHEFLRWEPKPPRYIPPEGYDTEKAMYIMRTQGMEAYERYCDLFKPEVPEDNIPILQIFAPTYNNGTKGLIDIIPSAQYDEKDKEDYAEFDGDDPLDTLRYLLKASSVYIGDVLAKTNYFQKEAEIIQDLNLNGDMHSYYMRMNALEAKQRQEAPHSVRRLGTSYLYRRGY